MKLKINSRLLFIAFLSMILTAALTISVFHTSFRAQAEKDIRLSSQTIAAAYPYLENKAELNNFTAKALRITLVAPDGLVLYESEEQKGYLENHVDRPEIAAALTKGTGESIRHSTTSGYDTYYYAVLLQDGNVLRVAMQAQNMYSIYDESIPLVILIGVGLMILSAVLSVMLTRSLIKPIESMAGNLDEIEKHVPYPELEPFAKAVREQQEKKQAVDRMRQEFTANVSHELKTPMTSISGYAEMIENGMAKEEDIKDFAGKIHNEACRLMNLVGDIIKLSELDDPTSIPDMVPVDMLGLIENTAELLSLQAEKAGIIITAEGEASFVRGNLSMIQEMVYNLCDNAIRYNRPGGSVRLEVVNEGQYVRVSVSDTGIGIPESHVGRIFERFYRVDKSRSKETGGTGLGLAIVKHIVIRHEGKIQVDSTEGQGTVIRILLKNARGFQQGKGKPDRVLS